MNYRINVKAVIVVSIFIIIAIVLFVYMLISAPTTPNDDPMTSTVAEEQSSDWWKTAPITAKHQYRGGLHTVVGSVDMPNTCGEVQVEPFFTDDTQGQVELRFVDVTPGDVVCGDAITPVPFRVTFEAPEDVVVTASWEGVSVTLNLILVSPDAILDDSDIYKG